MEQLRRYGQPVFVYLPRGAELRGGAWVVLDSQINPGRVEMFAGARAVAVGGGRRPLAPPAAALRPTRSLAPALFFRPRIGRLLSPSILAPSDLPAPPQPQKQNADPSARGGVLEPEGLVEIKYRTPDLLRTMHRRVSRRGRAPRLPHRSAPATRHAAEGGSRRRRLPPSAALPLHKRQR